MSTCAQNAPIDAGLERFVSAQAPMYAEVVRELKSGRKTGHWMWYIFPQIAGLGRSNLARFYAISSRTEARAYLDHPVLGPRLRECTALVNAIPKKSLEEIFGPVDALKFRSCMTLFSRVTTGDAVFQSALDRYCEGRPDQATIERLDD